MSKKVQAIIAGSIVIVLLVAAIAALVLTQKSESTDKELPSSQNGLISLIEGVAGELEYVTVKNKNDEYKIELLGENKWGIKALDGFVQTDTMYNETVESLNLVYASSIIEENCTDLAKFGLDSPSLVTEIKYKGKDGYKFTLGDISPDGYSRYAIKTGQKTVYALSTSSFSALLQTKFDYIVKAVIPALEVGEDGKPLAPALDAVKISRPDMAKPLILEKYKAGELTENAISSTGLKMTSPVNAMVNETNVQDKIFSLFGLAASGVEAINPTAQDLTKYGFDKPTSTLEMTYNQTSSIKITTGSGVECKHEVGEDLTGHKHQITHYYAMREGTNIIYTLTKDSVTWMNMQPKNLMSSIAVLAPVLDIDSVNFKIGNEEYKINYIKAADKTDTKEITATVNGKKVDADSAKKLLQLFYSTSIQDVNTMIPTKPANASVTYNYTNGKTDIVEFFVLEDRNIIISVNGNNAFSGRSGYVEKMIKEVKNLVEGKPIDTGW
ncbi:MAG: DUF4340 domain-containing protein [Oscillospiraceae bacterium]